MRTIAAFDFDGTITTGDSFIRFAFYSLGPFRFLLRSILVIPALFTFNRNKIKERALYAYFGGLSLEAFREKVRSFTERELPRFIRKKALQEIEFHKSKGHQLILVSAAFEEILHPFAEQHGFEAVVASRMSLETGKLIGPNCRGHEKVKRLLLVTGPKKNYTLYAYGDSRGDRELLALADFPAFRKF